MAATSTRSMAAAGGGTASAAMKRASAASPPKASIVTPLGSLRTRPVTPAPMATR
jgi:hypothetical protein